MDTYTKERYKRWVKQKIRRRVGFMLIILLLLVNMILMVVVIFNWQSCNCPNTSDYLTGNNTGEYAEESGGYIEERLRAVEKINVIPGRYAFLTFDDGPSPYTQSILDVLNTRNISAIFFVVGAHINHRSDSGELLNRMIEEGHYIGLHTMTHDSATLYDGEDAPERFVDEMFELNELIFEMTGFSTNLCRAAYGMAGNFTPQHHTAVDESDLYCVDWNIDSRDWPSYTTPYMVYQNVTSQIERLDFPDELVILFHEYSWTVEALPVIINYLRYHGYTIVGYTPGDVFTYYRNRD